MSIKPQARHAAIAVAVTAALLGSGCATWDSMSRADKGTAAGAVVGGVLGNVVSDSVFGTIGGAVVGGVVGREASKR